MIDTYRLGTAVSALEDAATAQAVLDMLCDTMQQLNAGEEADAVPCQRLGTALDADAAVTLAINPGVAPVVCARYPDEAASDGLVAFLRRRNRGAPSEQIAVSTDPTLGHVAEVAIRANPADSQFAGMARVLCFSRRIPFDATDYSLLEQAGRALVALWPHAARAYTAARAVEASRSLAQEHQMTVRELQVLALLAEGLLATSIASRLSLSPRTVHKHLGNIYRKLGVHDRLVAVSLARVQGLVYATGSPVSPSSPSRID